MVLGLLFIDNAYATHFLKTASEVCKINQDIDFDMKWKQEDGSWEVEKISLKKGDHLKMHKHKKKNKLFNF